MDGTNTLFKADGLSDTPSVTIAGWTIDSNSIHDGSLG
jgi:hypothetical protein